VLGLVGCLVLVATLPVGSVVAGLVIFAVGVGGRAVVLSRRARRPSADLPADTRNGGPRP
jgi:APA family basic amino acid/polyamine antiporter